MRQFLDKSLSSKSDSSKALRPCCQQQVFEPKSTVFTIMLPIALFAVGVSGWSISRSVTSTCESEKSPWDSNWDMKAGSNAKGIRQIILIRHGQYVQDVKVDEKRVLTELGRKQAVKTGERLAQLVKAKTVYPIRSVHQVQACSMIREGAVCRPDPPSVSWHPSDEKFAKQGLRVEAAFRNYFHRAVHDDRGAANTSDTTTSATSTATEDGNYSDIFVCHGNVIRYFVMRALQLPPEAWLRLAVSNASITVLYVYPSGRVSLYNLGDVGHLPPELITYN